MFHNILPEHNRNIVMVIKYMEHDFWNILRHVSSFIYFLNTKIIYQVFSYFLRILYIFLKPGLHNIEMYRFRV